MGKIMHDIELITKIQRQLKDLYQNIGDSMVSGGPLTIWKNTSICWDRHMPTNIFLRKSLTC